MNESDLVHNHTALLPKMLSSSSRAVVLESGLMLKQVKAGDGLTYPNDGDTPFVEYAGYLQSQLWSALVSFSIRKTVTSSTFSSEPGRASCHACAS